MTSQDGFIIYLNQEKTRWDVLQLAVLALAAFGSTLLAGQVFMESPPWGVLFGAAAAGILLSGVPSKAFQNGVLMGMVILTALLVTAGRGLFRSGLLQLVNAGIALFNYRYGGDVYYYNLPEGVNESLGLALFAGSMLFLLAYGYRGLLAGRRVRIFGLVCGLQILLALFLGAGSRYVGLVLLAAAICGGMLLIRIDEAAGRSRLLLTGLVVMTMLAGLSYMQWGQYEPSPLADAMRLAVSDQAQALRYGGQDAPMGDLQKAGAYQGTEATRLIVCADRSGNYYLKGFVGGSYQNGRWQQIDPSRYSQKQAGLFLWMKSMGFSPLAQNNQYLQLLEENGQSIGAKPSRVLVANHKANRKFLYLPYGVSYEDIAGRKGINRDMNLRQTEDDQAVSEYETLLYDTAEAFAAGNPAWMNGRKGQPGVEEFRQAQVEYRTFVYDNYLDLEEPMRALIAGQLNPAEGEGYLEATKTIQTWLKEEAPGADAGAEGRDPLYRFMFAGRQGNSCFYASAGVMLFRYFGIPARYAEGYLASLGQPSYRAEIKTEKKLEGASGNLPDYRRRITGKHMHAWVEIYKDGIGWVPIEVTPDFVKEIRQQTQVQHQQSQAEGGRQEGPQTEEKDGEIPWRLLGGILLGLLLAAAASMVCRRQVILRRRRKGLGEEAVSDRLQALLPWVKACLLLDDLTEEDLPGELRDILQRYWFRDQTMAEDEYEMILRYGQAQCEAAYEAGSRRRRLYMKYIKALK